MLPVGILMSFVAMKAARPRLQHHEPRRHRHRHRRHDRRRHRHDRERPQALERARPTSPAWISWSKPPPRSGPALFSSLLIITVSFLPIFTLDAQEGACSGPLPTPRRSPWRRLRAVVHAGARTDGAVRAGRIIPEHHNPLNRLLIAIYRPVIRLVLQAKTVTIIIALAVLAISVWPMTRLGTEFMPNLDEGTLLYMPTTLPGLSVTKAVELLQMQDRIIGRFRRCSPFTARPAGRRPPPTRHPSRCSRPSST
jgi:Cu(I)/Ag(I) efflux system membrane protein CusA/SilA